jgi:hypothetical protein
MSLFKKALHASPAYQAVKLGTKVAQQHSEQKQQVVPQQVTPQAEQQAPQPEVKTGGFLDNIRAKQQEHNEKIAELQEARGDKLQKLSPVDFMGGYKDVHANTGGGSLIFYKNVVEYSVLGSKKRSFTISNKDIADITFDGKDEFLQQRTITRNLLLAGKSKKQEVKDGYIVFALSDGQEVMFHIKDKSPMELKAKLSGVVSRIKQGQPTATPSSSTTQGSIADEITKLATLKQQGILTQEEFDKKKAQLLG